MKLINLFNLSSLKFRRLFIIVLSTQLIFLGTIGLDKIDIHIPILREFVGFIYLTFIPGVLTLRILRLHKLDNVESVLYSSGISISILMFLGFFINTVYPYFGIEKPFSCVPILISIYFVTFILLILGYIIDRDYSCEDSMEFKSFLNPRVLSLCLIPFLAILGTQLVTVYNNNVFLLLLLVIIAIIPLLVGFNKILFEDLYPLTIFIISISLLYHSSLISQYLWGTDTHVEYYASNLVQTSGFWDSDKSGNIYSVLSINILAPIYSIFLDIDSKWVLKIVFPFIFSFVPLGLYRIFKEQTNEKIAFFSSFFFMSITPFYTIMLEVPRQQIGEVFFVLYFLLMVNDSMDVVKKKILSIVFVFSLLVSHYGLAYIYIFSLSLSWLILFIIKKYPLFKVPYLNDVPIKGEILTTNITVLALTFTVLWYMMVSKSSVFEVIVSIAKNIITTFSSGFFDKNEVEGLNLIAMNTVSPLHSITKYLHLISQLFIFIGIFSILFIKLKLRKNFFAYSMVFLCITTFILVAPNSSSTMGINRVYSILLLLLSQFVPLGCISIVYILLKRTNKDIKEVYSTSFKFLSMFLSLFILFNTGFVYEVANDHPQSISLNPKLLHPRYVYNDGDMGGVKWLVFNINEEATIYSDQCEQFLLYEFMDKNRVYAYTSKKDFLPSNSYILMGPLGYNYNEIVDSYFNSSGFSREYLKFNDSTFYRKVILHSDEIYDNGIAYVCKS